MTGYYYFKNKYSKCEFIKNKPLLVKIMRNRYLCDSIIALHAIYLKQYIINEILNEKAY